MLRTFLSTGVPRSRRGEIWQLLLEQHQVRHSHGAQPEPQPPYQDLLKQLTAHQHAILIDLGAPSVRKHTCTCM